MHVGCRHISALRDQGLDIPDTPQQPCEYFTRRDVPLKFIDALIFDFWERQLNMFFGIFIILILVTIPYVNLDIRNHNLSSMQEYLWIHIRMRMM